MINTTWSFFKNPKRVGNKAKVNQLGIVVLGEALAVSVSFMWASSMILLARPLKDMETLGVNALRILFSALAMLPIFFVIGDARNLSGLDLEAVSWIIFSTIIGYGIGDTILFKSVTLIGISRPYTISSSMPLFTMILALAFLGEPFVPSYLLGALLILMGTVIAARDKNDHVEKRKNLKGVAAALTASVLFAIGIVSMAYSLRKISVVTANMIRFPILFVLLFLVSQLWRKKITLSRTSLAFLVVSSLLGVLGEVFFLFSVQILGASQATPLTASSPVWVALMSSALLREKLSWRIVVSSLLVVAGTYFLT